MKCEIVYGRRCMGRDEVGGGIVAVDDVVVELGNMVHYEILAADQSDAHDSTWNNKKSISFHGIIFRRFS